MSTAFERAAFAQVSRPLKRHMANTELAVHQEAAKCRDNKRSQAMAAAERAHNVAVHHFVLEGLAKIRSGDVLPYRPEGKE